MTPPVQLAAGVGVKVAGQELDPAIELAEARVQDNLMLPDAFSLRLLDRDFALVDGSVFTIGAKVELHFAGASEPGGPDGVFTGEIATLAPHFEHEGAVLVVRGYDKGHRLTRTRNTRTFQDMTASDIAKKVIGEAGLQAQVDATTDVYPFEQQSNETDWDFLWRLARRVGCEVCCISETINFRKPGDPAGPGGGAVVLEWGTTLKGFHPRATAVQQVKDVVVSGWDPATKRRVSSTMSSPHLDSTIQLQRDSVADGHHHVADEIVTTQSEADALAQSTLDRLANAWLSADGRCVGNPRVRAGDKVRVTGVGNRFSGEYLVTQSTHILKGRGGYETEFEISGRNRRTLLDLLTPTRDDGYAESLVVGVVTNNDDPEKMGRVRVKFPGLDDSQEGWWARVTSPSASGGRGLMMMPLVDDEVVVGFEHGDVRRPFVLGSLWNGKTKPADLAGKGGAKPDGSFNLHSDEKVSIASGDDMALDSSGMTAIRGSKEIDVTAQDDIVINSQSGGVTVETAAGTIDIAADGSVSISGMSISIDAQADLKISATGVVQVSAPQIMLG